MRRCLVALLIVSLSLVGLASTLQYREGATTLQNSFAVTLKVSQVASISFFSEDFFNQGVLKSDLSIKNLPKFLSQVQARITQITSRFTRVKGYAIFFYGIKFSPKAIQGLSQLIQNTQLQDGSPLAAKLVQIGFVDNSVNNNDVSALVALVNSLPNLEFFDAASNPHFDEITPLILSLDGLKHFEGLNTRLTRLDSQSTFYLFRSILQNRWQGVALNLSDVFEANAFEKVLQQYSLRHIGIRCQNTVGRESIDRLLKTMAKTQKPLYAIHLSLPESLTLTSQEVNWIVALLNHNVNYLHVVTFNLAKATPKQLEQIVNAIAGVKHLYGLALGANFLAVPSLANIIQGDNDLVGFEPIGRVDVKALKALLPPPGSKKVLCVDTNRIVPLNAQVKVDEVLKDTLICSSNAALQRYENWQDIDH
ncbi:MAG: hypothetical protein COV52_06905 [Gammaproteobacteria bacterium CG11_big_fil_rev_8_21_14_0_20_46_22]|nr:MAG: hypothetical protein COW05_02295 [Gammaproteobacteria bacterium CG12_big_fil_rev_8_21_14_0_65_46_12]PIR10769.1 MAG: hypothetical protein COV52_06905 [Gammaproteobacteria bacterium CG11_big_fil_rev_8_21_14_0_20_46_22]